MQFTDYSDSTKENRYKHKDEVGSYSIEKVIANSGLTGRGAEYTYKGYHSARWLISYEKLENLDKQGRLIWNSKGNPYRKLYLDEMKGIPIQDVWTDINISKGKERLGYPTQKPESLLDRIIQTSSNEGDIVADFFCGCGTTASVASRLKRKFIGCDISPLSISLVKKE